VQATFRPTAHLQELVVPGITPLQDPIRINGQWFLPATAGQVEQLNLYWNEAPPGEEG